MLMEAGTPAQMAIKGMSMDSENEANSFHLILISMGTV